MILDCCHCGSTLELPWVYKADEYGNINLMDNLDAGMELMGEAQGLIQYQWTGIGNKVRGDRFQEIDVLKLEIYQK